MVDVGIGTLACVNIPVSLVIIWVHIIHSHCVTKHTTLLHVQ